MRHRNALHESIAAACALLIATQGAAADSGGIQEVIVTAQKREENLQATPIAISVLSDTALANQGITSFEGVAKASPSITFTPYPNSSNLLILYLRGQGVSDPAQITSDGSVGLYQDGFYISRPQAATFDLADIERVEVLRGPQGTLYGRNTTGGAVNLISKKPTGEFGFKQNFTFGSRNQWRSLTSVDLPAWHDLAAKLTLLKSEKDGYVKNSGSSHDFGEEAQRAGRLALRWQPTDAFTADYFLERGELDSTAGYYQNTGWNGFPMVIDGAVYTYQAKADSPDGHTYRPIDLPLSTSDFEGHGLTLSWDVSDALTLKSLTGYRELHWRAYQDFAEAFAYVISVDPLLAVPTRFTSDNEVGDHQFSQEFQAIGDLFEHRLRYVAGLYYFREGGNSNANGLTSVLGTDKQTFRHVNADAKSLAAYSQLTFTPPILDDRLSLTVGARFTRDYRSAERRTERNGIPIETGGNHDQRFSKFNPALTIDYAWNDDISTYAKVVTGYKAGGFSESGPDFHFDSTFSPETVTTYELGLKSYAWQRRLRLNLAAFESRFDDMQLAFAVDPFDASVVQGYNAGKATVRGFEADLLLAPIDDLTFSLEYAYLDPKFDRVDALAGTTFDPAVNPAVAGVYRVGQDIKDLFSLPYAPKHSLNLGADYTFLHLDAASVAAHLDYHFQSSIYATATSGPDVPGRDNVQIPSYGTLNGRVTLTWNLPRGDTLRFGLWGRNLAHHDYPVQRVGMGNAIATSNPLGGVTGAGYVQNATIWAEPASFGVDVGYQY